MYSFGFYQKSQPFTLYTGTWMSPTIYITLQIGLIIFFVSAVFLENRIFQPRYDGTTKKRRFLSENDDIRGAFPHKEDTGRIQTVVFGRGYAHLKNSTFILSAIVNEPYVVEKRFTTHFKDEII